MKFYVRRIDVLPDFKTFFSVDVILEDDCGNVSHWAKAYEVIRAAGFNDEPKGLEPELSNPRTAPNEGRLFEDCDFGKRVVTCTSGIPAVVMKNLKANGHRIDYEHMFGE